MSGSQTCVRYIGAETRTCGATPTRLYIQGPFCAAHGFPQPEPAPRPEVPEHRRRPPMTEAQAAAFIAEWNTAAIHRASQGTPRKKAA